MSSSRWAIVSTTPSGCGTPTTLYTATKHIKSIATRTVSYLGVLHQALRDLSNWVEKGVPPPVSTNYKVIDGQVIVPKTAAERAGIQPVVALSANGSSSIQVPVGTSVSFEAVADVPRNTGKIVEARLDMDGAGTFPIIGKIVPVGEVKVKVSTIYTFNKPGTYFPTVRVVSQRQADAQAPYARIQNLARMRVEVREKPGS